MTTENDVASARVHPSHPLARDAGYVLALGALLMLPLIVAVGFAVDLGSWLAQANREQRAADAAALAGVTWLPDVGTATDVALEAAAKNGYCDAAAVSANHCATANANITVTQVPGQRLQVLVESSADIFFAGLVMDDLQLSRQAIAENLLPVPMGSPRNFIGTHTLSDPGLAVPENFWVSVSGYCARREHGDRITPRTDGNQTGGDNGSFEGCSPAVSPPSKNSSLGANPEWRDWGYLYAIEFEQAYTGTIDIDLYNAPHCQPNTTHNTVRAATVPGDNPETLAPWAMASDFEDGDVVDGVPVGTGDRILIKDMSNGIENGIYEVEDSGPPTRTSDADDDAEIFQYMALEVSNDTGATVNDGTTWRLQTHDPIILGTSLLNFSQVPDRHLPDSGGSNSAARQYEFIVRDSDNPFDPVNATQLHSQILSPSDCPTWEDWHNLYSLTDPKEGIYYVQIKPVEPVDKTGSDSAEGQNQLSLRAKDPDLGSSWACSSDPTEGTPDAPYSASCAQVYGLTHLGVYLDNLSGISDFYLASINDDYAERTVQVELFDAAENTDGISILDPAGNKVEFTWEVACQDGTYQSETAVDCTASMTPENAPDGGYGDGSSPVTFLPTDGSADKFDYSKRPWGSRNSQRTKYSDRIIRLEFDLPSLAAEPTWFGGNTWYQIQYDAGLAGGDRTTWTVKIIGDPVRLVE